MSRPLNIGTFSSTVGVLPSVPGGLGQKLASGYFSDGFTLVQHPITHREFYDDLIWCVQRGPT